VCSKDGCGNCQSATRETRRRLRHVATLDGLDMLLGFPANARAGITASQDISSARSDAAATRLSQEDLEHLRRQPEDVGVHLGPVAMSRRSGASSAVVCSTLNLSDTTGTGVTDYIPIWRRLPAWFGKSVPRPDWLMSSPLTR
jgi:hypothetical protein